MANHEWREQVRLAGCSTSGLTPRATFATATDPVDVFCAFWVAAQAARGEGGRS